MRRYILAAILTMSPLLANAVEQPRVNLGAGSFKDQNAAITFALNKDPNYIEASVSDLRTVQVSLDRLMELLGEGASATQLSAENMKEASALQESINSRLVRIESDSRWTCRQEQKLGTNLFTRVCKTHAAMQRDYERTQDEFNSVGTRIDIRH